MNYSHLIYADTLSDLLVAGTKLVDNIVKRIVKTYQNSVAARELRRLDDRALRDIGLTRDQIRRLDHSMINAETLELERQKAFRQRGR